MAASYFRAYYFLRSKGLFKRMAGNFPSHRLIYETLINYSRFPEGTEIDTVLDKLGCRKSLADYRSENKKPKTKKQKKEARLQKAAKKEKAKVVYTDYKDFLASDVWKEIRGEALRLASHKCSRCKATAHLQVHHLSYKARWGKEKQKDLVVLCRSCHVEVHQPQEETVEEKVIVRKGGLPDKSTAWLKAEKDSLEKTINTMVHAFALTKRLADVMMELHHRGEL